MTGLTSITSVRIPSSVTSIESFAFYECSSLTSVTIPSSVTNIGREAFGGCSSLTSVTIPSSVTIIGDYAFSGCTGLTSVTIPSSVTSIGNSAFYGCFFLPENFKNLSSCTSDNYYCGATLCDIDQEDGLLIIDNVAVKCREWATSVTIPNSVTSIGNEAFSNCSGLTSVTIGNSVTCIGDYAFYGCANLMSVTSYAKEPPLCGSYVFYDKPDDAVLTVYKSSVYSYLQADQWKDFIIDTMPDYEEPIDEPIDELKDLLKKYEAEIDDFKKGAYNGQYDMYAVEELMAAMSFANEVIFYESSSLSNPEAYIRVQEYIQEAIKRLKFAYQAVLDSKRLSPIDELKDLLKKYAAETDAFIEGAKNGQYDRYVVREFLDVLEKVKDASVEYDKTILVHPEYVEYLQEEIQVWLTRLKDAHQAVLDSKEMIDGVSSLTPTPSAKANEIYDLQGRKVKKPASGLFIQNGKKVLNK